MVMLLAVLGSTGAWAEDGVITVGSGGRSSSYLPVYPNNKYSLSQQIYTKDEIGNKGMITSIAFYNYDTGSARVCDIYLTHTAKESFDSSTDWVTVSAEDKVYSGKMELKSNWTVIEFDTPFQYDGEQNLLLTVDDNTGEDTGFNYSVGASDASGNQSLYYYKMFGNPANLDPTQAITEEGTVYYRKNQIRLCFETYPKPFKFEAVEVGDVSAKIQCSLRDGATGWKLRYREAVAEGEQEQSWLSYDNITDGSYTLEALTPATKYEVQAQAIYPDDKLSAWTDVLVFTTNCCPVEEQAEIIYSMNSDYRNWFNYGVRIIDITNEDKPVEVAFLRPPSYELYGGTLILCCGHKYKVNWIYDKEHPDFNRYYSLALYFEPGDLFYKMGMGTAPEEDAELTTFVMDCTPYCTQKPQNVSVAGVTFDSATLSFRSETTGGEVAYSTEAGFNPDTATPASVGYTALSVNPDSWEPNPANASITLTGLEPLTEYYVSVRNVCIDELTGEPAGKSRWSDPVKVTTGSRLDAPSQVIAKSVNSRTEKLSWGARGNEKGYNLYYRKQAAGNPVNMDDVGTFGGGHGTGFEIGSWGEGIFSSYGSRPFSNTIYVGNVPAGSSFGFKAGNGKTGAGKTQFLYGMRKAEDNLTAKQTMIKFDRKCLNDADRQARIKELQDKKADLEKQLAELASKLANGEMTQEQYDLAKEQIDMEIDAVNADLAELESLPTDAQKLERMKELEKAIKENKEALAALVLKLVKGEISQEEYRSEKAGLESQNALAGSELSELRAITTNAENPNKDGFSITKEKESAQARGARAAEEAETYIFFIRHDDSNGVLLVKDLTITPPEKVNEWIKIPDISGTEYTLKGLEPGTTYEVMVEPVYEDGSTGTPSAITVFTTIGEETDPTESEFSVAEGKTVNFARGNLRCTGDRYEAEWSMAKQQYDVLGQDNIDVQGSRSYPAWLVDLLCWSTTKNYYGIDNFYYYGDEEALPYFQADFADWGENPTLIADLGEGWSTLTKAEWDYLLNERENATSLKAFATINKVKGLVLLPDEWTAPEGITLDGSSQGDTSEESGASVELTTADWTKLEQAGAVFLPAAGQLTTTYVDNITTTTVANDSIVGLYWTATPSDKEMSDADAYSYALAFADTAVVAITTDTVISRRTALAVRLVKEVKLADKTALNEAIAEATGYYDGIKTDYADIAATLKEAIDAAQAVADNRKATQEEVDAAKQALDEALAKAKADVEIASSVATVKTVKSSGVRYNLSGQRVGKAYKGIVIVDGAKTIRK